jgi:hypothetical protein
MVREIVVKDAVKLIIITIVPPVASFIGAALANSIIDDVFRMAAFAQTGKAPRELVDKAVLLYYIWALIPMPQVAVCGFTIWTVKNGGIHSMQVRRIAPWLIAAGFFASLASIPLYGNLLSLLNPGWRELTVIAYFVPMLLTYVNALNLLVD